MSFGMLMDDDNSDNGVNFGGRRGLGRRVASARSSRMYRGFGDEYTWPGSPYEDQGYPVGEPINNGDPYGTVTPTPVGTTGNTGTGATDWWSLLGQGIATTTQVVGGIVKMATNGTSCNDPTAPYYSPATRMCYPTPQAAAAASGGGNGGLLLVGALGVGMLAWLMSGKGGPSAG